VEIDPADIARVYEPGICAHPEDCPCKRQASPEPEASYIDIVFDGPPEHEAGRFVEVENPEGRSVRVGKWIKRENGWWSLRLPWSQHGGLTTDPDLDSSCGE